MRPTRRRQQQRQSDAQEQVDNHRVHPEARRGSKILAGAEPRHQNLDAEKAHEPDAIGHQAARGHVGICRSELVVLE